MKQMESRKFSILAIIATCLIPIMAVILGVPFLFLAFKLSIRVRSWLVLGCWFVEYPLSLAVLILGSIAAHRIRKFGQRGMGLAVLCIFFGSLAFLFFAYFTLYVLSYARSGL